ncbi:MAG: sulfite exporter TauE/SafE family protein [Puniceicoccaceae bacterium]
MLDTATITSTSAAFIAGAVTSIHCIGMCGPLACAFGGGAPHRDKQYALLATYHSTRILSYGVIGAIAGTIGTAPMAYFHHSLAGLLPWVLVLLFLALALGVEKRIPKPAFVSKLLFRIRLKSQKYPPHASAAVLGLATPAMPCGPLYLVFAVAMMTGSTIRGFEFLIAFALGTLPLLGAFHAGIMGARGRLSPLWMNRFQRTMAFLVAVIFALRLSMGSANVEAVTPSSSESPPTFEAHCPLCP